MADREESFAGHPFMVGAFLGVLISIMLATSQGLRRIAEALERAHPPVEEDK